MRTGLLIAMLMLVSVSFSQPQGMMGGGAGIPAESVITGQVFDAVTGHAIEYAQVTVYKMKDSTMVSGMVTDTVGRFKLENLSYGRFMVDVSFMGFKKTRIKGIMLKPDNKMVNIGEIKLEPENIAIGEVQINGQKASLEYKIDKKVVNVSSNLMATGATAVEALENVPSVQTTVEGDVTLRGSDNFVVLIDGKPSQIGGSDALKLIPASTIDKIEIITNPSAKYEAEGGAGIINVIMKKNISTGLNGIINLTGGSTFRAKDQNSFSGDFTLNMRQNKFNYFINGDSRDGRNYANIEFIQQKPVRGRDTIIKHIENSGLGYMAHGGASLRGGFDYNINDNQTISLSGGYERRGFKRDFGANYVSEEYYNGVSTGADTFYQVNSPIERYFDNYRLNLDYTLKLNDKHELYINSYFGNSSAGIESPTTQTYFADRQYSIVDSSFSKRQDETSSGKIGQLKADYTFKVNDEIRIESGLFGNINNSNSYNTDVFLLPGNNVDTLSELDYLFVDNVYAGYLTFSHTTPWFSYQLGLRNEFGDRNLDIKNDTAFKLKHSDWFPTVHLSKQFPGEVEMQMSYSKRINRPRAFNLLPTQIRIDNENVRVGNPELKPEITDAFELSVRKSFMKVGFVSVDLFHKINHDEFERIISRDSATGLILNKPENVNMEKNTGAELMLNMPLAKWWMFNSTFTYYRNEIIDQRVRSDSKLNDEWELRASSIFRFKTNTQIQLTYMYNSEQRELQGFDYASHMTMLGIRQEIDKKTTLALQVRDIFQTGIRGSESWGTNIYTKRKFQMVSPVYMLTLTYKINNYSKKNNNRQGEDMNQIDFGM